MTEAAAAKGLPVGKEDSRTHVYGIPYGDWKALHQTEAPPERLAAFEAGKPTH